MLTRTLTDYAIFIAQRDASGHLPDHIFLQFDSAAKTAWTKLPHASQKLIVSLLTEPASPGVPSASSFASGRPPYSRQVYFYDASSPPDDEQFFDAAEASSPPHEDELISGLQTLLINATSKSATHQPVSRPPVVSSKAPLQAQIFFQFQRHSPQVFYWY